MHCQHSVDPFFFLQIERWWRELHNRFERFFKRQLTMLFEQGHYDPSNQTDRYSVPLYMTCTVVVLFNSFYRTEEKGAVICKWPKKQNCFNCLIFSLFMITFPFINWPNTYTLHLPHVDGSVFLFILIWCFCISTGTYWHSFLFLSFKKK